MSGDRMALRSHDSLRPMTDFGIDFRSSDDFLQLRDRVAAARAQTRANAERYVQLRRTADATRDEARDLCTQAAQLRETLRESVMVYAAALRRTSVPPERAVVLVKTAVIESDFCPDKHNRHVVEEAVRWAVDAYYAA
jgi:hypothetical protein